MGVRKSVEETLVVDGTPDEWLEKARRAMEATGFHKITVDPHGILRGDLKQRLSTVWWGSLAVRAAPEGEAMTRLTLQGTANANNISAVFQIPGQKVIDTFKAGLR